LPSGPQDLIGNSHLVGIANGDTSEQLSFSADLVLEGSRKTGAHSSRLSPEAFSVVFRF
jgi:hypothetical protein